MMREKWICPAPAGQDGVGSPHTERTLSARLRGLLALAVCLCLTLPLLPAPAQAAETPTGSWTDAQNCDTSWYDNAPTALTYTISTAEELAGLAVLVNGAKSDFTGKTVALSDDIDLSAHYWPGIGGGRSSDTRFSGAFDGGGHTVSFINIKEMKWNGGQSYFGGFFTSISNGATIKNLRLSDISLTAKIESLNVYWGALVGQSSGEILISDCVVERVQFDLDFTSSSSRRVYVAGLLALARDSGSTTSVSNCEVLDYAVTVRGSGTDVGGIQCAGLGQGTYENCFVSINAINIPAEGSSAYMGFSTVVDPDNFSTSPTVASSCYWLDSGLVEKDQIAGTECYEVTKEQILGTGSSIIGTNHANTSSLIIAMNNWVDAHAAGAYTRWGLSGGLPRLSPYLPKYMDISGPLDEVTHQSATGDIETGMELEGQIQENVTLLSVTLPASIPFIVDVEANGAFKRVLSATGTLTNRSDTGVNITLTAVTDDGGLLDNVDLFLVPDPAPSGDKPQIALAKGDGKTDLLAALATPAADGTPTTATLKVDGAAKNGVTSIGSDGEQFVVGLTLKVSKQTVTAP